MIRRPPYDPGMFAPPPARDPRFEVKEQWVDCRNEHADEAQREIEFLHRQMNEEINSVECCARNLVDFPDADWNLRLEIARQCCDEARHVEMFRNVFEQRGGRVGEHPVLNFQFRIVTNVTDLGGRLAVQNRGFEAEGVDAIEPEIAAARERGDHVVADLYEAQLADEIAHVRFANEYLARSAASDPASVMRVGRALNYASEAFFQVMGQDAIDAARYAVNRNGRLEAGFRTEEIRHIGELRKHREASPAPESE
jgi:uncharacterized ferritin-like protein (DUF455 family)